MIAQRLDAAMHNVKLAPMFRFRKSHRLRAAKVTDTAHKFGPRDLLVQPPVMRLKEDVRAMQCKRIRDICKLRRQHRNSARRFGNVVVQVLHPRGLHMARKHTRLREIDHLIGAPTQPLWRGPPCQSQRFQDK